MVAESRAAFMGSTGVDQGFNAGDDGRRGIASEDFLGFENPELVGRLDSDRPLVALTVTVAGGIGDGVQDFHGVSWRSGIAPRCPHSRKRARAEGGNQGRSGEGLGEID